MPSCGLPCDTVLLGMVGAKTNPVVEAAIAAGSDGGATAGVVEGAGVEDAEAV